MKRNIGLMIYYHKLNKYSFNALVSALEIEEYFENLKIYFVRDKNELILNLGEIIKTHEKVIVAISFFTPQLWNIYYLIKILKKKYSDKKILYIAGGPHPTGDPSGTLKMGFDVVIKGEGEETFIELLKKIDSDEDFRSIKGISFINENGEYIFTGKRNFVELDKYPPFSVKYNKFGPIEITRGCPFVCYFCQTPYIFGAKVRHRSIEKICKYVEIMKKKNLTDIRFITPDAFSYGSKDGKTLNIEKLKELFSSVRKILGSQGRMFIGSFPSEVRPEHVTEETVKLVREYADNKNLIIGAQSGSQRILDICHRGHTVEDVYRAVKITLKAGLIPNVDFIFGLPGETQEDIQLTIKVMKDLAKMGARIHAHTFMPLPQTPFAKAPPGKVDKNLRKIIKELIPKGILYGKWREQEEIARRIAKYFQTGRIEIK